MVSNKYLEGQRKRAQYTDLWQLSLQKSIFSKWVCVWKVFSCIASKRARGNKTKQLSSTSALQHHTMYRFSPGHRLHQRSIANLRLELSAFNAKWKTIIWKPTVIIHFLFFFHCVKLLRTKCYFIGTYERRNDDKLV